jgi:hypothetical protein
MEVITEVMAGGTPGTTNIDRAIDTRHLDGQGLENAIKRVVAMTILAMTILIGTATDLETVE